MTLKWLTRDADKYFSLSSATPALPIVRFNQHWHEDDRDS